MEPAAFSLFSTCQGFSELLWLKDKTAALSSSSGSAFGSGAGVQLSLRVSLSSVRAPRTPAALCTCSWRWHFSGIFVLLHRSGQLFLGLQTARLQPAGRGRFSPSGEGWSIYF